MSSTEQPQESGKENAQIDRMRTRWADFSSEHGFILVLGIFVLIFLGVVQLANTGNRTFLMRTQRSAARG